MLISRKNLALCAGLFVFSQILFLINIQFPRGHNFDEFHYVPSAKQFLDLKENQISEHPPLARELISIGIGIWGDRPIGWRFMSTIFGSFTLVGMYLWALALFRNENIALWCSILTLVNQMLYVQARIGTLDVFMFAFIVWAMAAFTLTWQTSATVSQGKAFILGEPPAFPLPNKLIVLEPRRLIYFTGACLGFATACKWFGVIPWAMLVGLIFTIKLMSFWGTQFSRPSPDDWYHPDLWRGIENKDWIVGLVLLPLAAYFLTFFPFLLIDGKDYGFFKIFTTMQWNIWDGNLRVGSPHPYMSTWTDWPLTKRPIWYAFDHEGANNELVRGVLLIGNPWVMWNGLIALVACLIGWLKERRRDAFLILVCYVAFYFSWAVIPRKIAFYYYYYPAGMVLSFALAFMFFHGEKKLKCKTPWPRWTFLAIAIAFFVYFFPISAALQIPLESFRQWVWRITWI